MDIHMQQKHLDILHKNALEMDHWTKCKTQLYLLEYYREKNLDCFQHGKNFFNKTPKGMTHGRNNW
jgi:hypothetical protein